MPSDRPTRQRALRLCSRGAVPQQPWSAPRSRAGFGILKPLSELLEAWASFLAGPWLADRLHSLFHAKFSCSEERREAVESGGLTWSRLVSQQAAEMPAPPHTQACNGGCSRRSCKRGLCGSCHRGDSLRRLASTPQRLQPASVHRPCSCKTTTCMAGAVLTATVCASLQLRLAECEQARITGNELCRLLQVVRAHPAAQPRTHWTPLRPTHHDVVRRHSSSLTGARLPGLQACRPHAARTHLTNN